MTNIETIQHIWMSQLHFWAQQLPLPGLGVLQRRGYKLLADNKICLSAWSGERQDPDNFRLSLQVEGALLYIMDIAIPEAYRGLGHGARLYTMAEDVARELSCRAIAQTASGRTGTGQDRRDYLRSRGWTGVGVVMVKDLPPLPVEQQQEQQMRYSLLSSGSLAELEIHVQQVLDTGWEPHGGPFVFGGKVCQAVIKCQPKQ